MLILVLLSFVCQVVLVLLITSVSSVLAFSNFLRGKNVVFPDSNALGMNLSMNWYVRIRCRACFWRETAAALPVSIYLPCAK